MKLLAVIKHLLEGARRRRLYFVYPFFATTLFSKTGEDQGGAETKEKGGCRIDHLVHRARLLFINRGHPSPPCEALSR
jgi:hypothetical protein